MNTSKKNYPGWQAPRLCPQTKSINKIIPDGAELHSVTVNEKPITSQNTRFFFYIKLYSIDSLLLKFKYSILAGYSAVKVATIPLQSTPPIPLQCTPLIPLQRLPLIPEQSAPLFS